MLEVDISVWLSTMEVVEVDISVCLSTGRGLSTGRYVRMPIDCQVESFELPSLHLQSFICHMYTSVLCWPTFADTYKIIESCRTCASDMLDMLDCVRYVRHVLPSSVDAVSRVTLTGVTLTRVTLTLFQ